MNFLPWWLLLILKRAAAAMTQLPVRLQLEVLPFLRLFAATCVFQWIIAQHCSSSLHCSRYQQHDGVTICKTDSLTCWWSCCSNALRYFQLQMFDQLQMFSQQTLFLQPSGFVVVVTAFSLRDSKCFLFDHRMAQVQRKTASCFLSSGLHNWLALATGGGAFTDRNMTGLKIHCNIGQWKQNCVITT